MSAHPSVSPRFSLAVKLLRTSRGMTQSQLASRMSAKGFRFDQQAVQGIEEGTHRVRLDEAYKLAEVADHLARLVALAETALASPRQGSDAGARHLSENQQRTFNQLTESLDHAVRPPSERHVSILRVLGGAARRTPASWVRRGLRGRPR